MDKSFNEKLDNNLKNTKEIFSNHVIERIIKENNEGKRDNGNFLWRLMMLNKVLK